MLFIDKQDGREEQRWLTLIQWFRDKDKHPEWAMQAGQRCGDAPFVFPTDGYLSRLPDWKSSVVMHVSSDPLQPSRQTWLYYTHMADKKNNIKSWQEFLPAFGR